MARTSEGSVTLEGPVHPLHIHTLGTPETVPASLCGAEKQRSESGDPCSVPLVFHQLTSARHLAPTSLPTAKEELFESEDLWSRSRARPFQISGSEKPYAYYGHSSQRKCTWHPSAVDTFMGIIYLRTSYGLINLNLISTELDKF